MATKKGKAGLIDLEFLTSEIILSNLVFILFLGLLCVAYIANAHLAERNARKIQDLQRELKEYRWQLTSIKADNMYNSQQSEMEKKLRNEGLIPYSELKRVQPQ